MIADRLTVHLNEEPVYDITFNDSYDNIADSFKEIGIINRKICIVSETNVASLYLDAILVSLSKSGLFDKVISFVFNAGEENKNLNVVKKLYERLINEQFDRKDILVALGGGVTGDLTGFTAATYLRGIDFIQVPTSLLAQVDSSIGGKTGVDFDSYKNMVGAFHMPKLVYMNQNVLKSLDRRQFVSGMGEVIKHGLILDKAYYEWIKENYGLINNYDYDTLCELVYRSCIVKRAVVEEDPTEKGKRALLNFGHTLGHALEKYMNFELLHGECVLIGSILASIISYNKDYIDKTVLNDITDTIKMYKIPELPYDLNIDKIIEYTKNDKKAVGDKIKFILLDDIGNAFIDMNVTPEDMKEAFCEYMRNYNN